jgi:hypothetical protein
MASPLLPYANSRVLVVSEGVPAVTDGRIAAPDGQIYLIKAFMKRVQYSGVSSGSKKIPLESQLDGRMLPGVSGDQFYYRGYALEYAVIASNYNWLTGNESSLTFNRVTGQTEWLLTGKEVQLRIGNDPILNAQIERSSGIFGGQGIDQIIYSEIGGVELQLTGTEVQN